MVRKLLQTVMVVLAVLVLVATVATAAEMTCTEADKNWLHDGQGRRWQRDEGGGPWGESGRQDDVRQEGDMHEEAPAVVSPSGTWEGVPCLSGSPSRGDRLVGALCAVTSRRVLPWLSPWGVLTFELGSLRQHGPDSGSGTTDACGRAKASHWAANHPLQS